MAIGTNGNSELANTCEVVNQLRFNTDCRHHRYDVLQINGVQCLQIELKKLGIILRRGIEQIVEYN